jgi:hypothetical protein
MPKSLRETAFIAAAVIAAAAATAANPIYHHPRRTHSPFNKTICCAISSTISIKPFKHD